MKLATSPRPAKVDEQTLKLSYPLTTVRPVTGWGGGVPMKVPLPLKLTEYRMPKEHNWGKRREVLQEYMIQYGAQTKSKQG